MGRSRVAVFGASGYVGSALALALSSQHEVYALSRFSDPAVAEELRQHGVRTVRYDAARDSLNEVVDIAPEYVFNELAVIWGKHEKEPDYVHRVNATFVAELFRAFRTCRGIVQASTGSVYLLSSRLLDESSPVANPVNVYCLTKACGDLYAMHYSLTYHVPCCILRYFHPYGSRRVGRGFDAGRISSYFDMVAAGTPIRDYPFFNPIDLSDLVSCTMRAAEQCAVPARIVNIGGGEVVTREELAARVSAFVGRAPVIGGHSLAGYCGDGDSWACSIALQRELFGEPKVSLAEGIAAANERWKERADSR